MPKSNTHANDLLLLEYNNTNDANVGDATGLRGSSAAGSFYAGLHTASPGRGGAQNANECSYTNYARVAIARSSSGFTVSANSVTLAAAVNFPQSDPTGNQIATHWSLGVASSGASKMTRFGVIGGPYKPFEADTGDTITCAAHGYAADDRVIFEALPGISLPTGITEGTRYFVLATGLATDSFKVSTTSGGTALDITVAGGGLIAKSIPITIGANTTPQLGTGTTITDG